MNVKESEALRVAMRRQTAMATSVKTSFVHISYGSPKDAKFEI
jgi:hypothetical protein